LATLTMDLQKLIEELNEGNEGGEENQGGEEDKPAEG